MEEEQRKLMAADEIDDEDDEEGVEFNPHTSKGEVRSLFLCENGKTILAAQPYRRAIMEWNIEVWLPKNTAQWQ